MAAPSSSSITPKHLQPKHSGSTPRTATQTTSSTDSSTITPGTYDPDVLCPEIYISNGSNTTLVEKNGDAVPVGISNSPPVISDTLRYNQVGYNISPYGNQASANNNSYAMSLTCPADKSYISTVAFTTSDSGSDRKIWTGTSCSKVTFGSITISINYSSKPASQCGVAK